MPFVKLDCGMLNSSLWPDSEARTVFITALLMASPVEIKEPLDQINVRSLKPTGFQVPPGWYGMVDAAGVGIVRRAGLEQEEGLAALERLSAPDPDSRSERFDGRRVARVNGGYLVLNYDIYRQKDHTAAARVRRYRERKALAAKVVTRDGVDVTRNVTQAEAEAEAESREQRAEEDAHTASSSLAECVRPADGSQSTLVNRSTAVNQRELTNQAEQEFIQLWEVCERRDNKAGALKAYLKARKSGKMPDLATVKEAYCRLAESWDWTKEDRQYHPMMSTWLNREGWNERPRGGGPPQSALKMIFPVKPNRTPEEEARMSEGAEIAED